MKIIDTMKTIKINKKFLDKLKNKELHHYYSPHKTSKPGDIEKLIIGNKRFSIYIKDNKLEDKESILSNSIYEDNVHNKEFYKISFSY